MNKSIILLLWIFLLNMSYAQTGVHCKKLQSVLNSFRNKHKVAGASLYVRRGDNPLNVCYLFSGTVKKGSNKPISGKNLWQIGSITKSYAAALLLQLEAESAAGKIPVKFNLDQKLKQWLPQYPDWGEVTIRQLLNMTSGIYSYTALPDVNRMQLENSKKIWSASGIVELAYRHKPNTLFAPGKGWRYSDTNYIMVPLIIQKIYKKLGYKLSFQEILNKNILDRLQLTDTYYVTHALNKNLLARMAHGYNYYSKKDYTGINLSFAGAAGAMISTPKQIAQWILDLFNGKVLAPKQLQAMRALVSSKTGRPIQSDKTLSAFGYSLGLMELYNKQLGEVWFYQGLTGGYTALYYYLPKNQTVITLVMSTGDIQTFPISYAKFRRDLFKIIFGLVKPKQRA